MSLAEVNNTYLNSLALSYLLRPKSIGALEGHLDVALETYPYRKQCLETTSQKSALTRGRKHELAGQSFELVDNIFGIQPEYHPPFFTGPDFAMTMARLKHQNKKFIPRDFRNRKIGSEILSAFNFSIHSSEEEKHIYKKWMDHFKERRGVYLSTHQSVVLCRTYSEDETLLIAAHEYVHALQHAYKVDFENKIITEGQAYCIQRKVADIISAEFGNPNIWNSWYVNYEVRLLAAAYRVLTDVSGLPRAPELESFTEEVAPEGTINHILGGALFILAEDEFDPFIHERVFRNDFSFLTRS